MTIASNRRSVPGWLSPADCDLDDFRAVAEQSTSLSHYPFASSVRAGVLIYAPGVSERATAGGQRKQLQGELARALADGPGIVVLQQAFPQREILDRASAVFEDLIARQKATGTVAGDHFGAPGANDRIWGALDKFAVHDPAAFAAYYANDVVALISEAWLGPDYQVTSQVNVVNPGGQAQVAHRDYHLGFMSAGASQAYPAHVHRLAPVMTLQGAVAHCDMPVQTGPTMYLPHSQKYEAGYLAFHQPEFTAYFDDHYVQLPLAAGDAVFFNPALFHGAGTNRSADVRRMANLLQVSSAFGRAMESVDRTAMCEALYPALRELHAAGAPPSQLQNIVAASAEGYAFPANLDRDQPVDGMAPPSQADLMLTALDQGWDAARFSAELQAQALRHQAAPQ